MSKDDDSAQSTTPFLNTTQEIPQASEDDYSVPYELKVFGGGKFVTFLNVDPLEFYIFTFIR